MALNSARARSTSVTVFAAGIDDERDVVAVDRHTGAGNAGGPLLLRGDARNLEDLGESDVRGAGDARHSQASSSETRSAITRSLSHYPQPINVILGSAEDDHRGKNSGGEIRAQFCQPGEIVDAYPDLVMSHTATWRSVTVMEKIGATKLYDPDRLAIVLDHIAPAKTEKNALDHAVSRNFARKYGIQKFYDVDAGIAHLVLMEAGHVAPGDLIVGTDSHCTIYGSLGALGTGIGYTEVTSVWITGKLWMKVPESFKINLTGAFRPGVYSKDLMLHLIGTLGADGCGYKSVEFHGDAARRLSISERMTMTNLAMEMGVKCAFVPPDAKTEEYLRGRMQNFARYTPIAPDADAVYEKELTVDLASLEPMVACPHEVENTKPIGEVAGHAHRSGVSGIVRQRQV